MVRTLPTLHTLYTVSIAAALVGCQGPTQEQPTSEGGPDAGAMDPVDAAAEPEPFGQIRGSCGTVAGELDSPSPSLARSNLAFARPFDDQQGDLERVAEGTRTILETPNAGGSSVFSEAFAFEVLHRCEGAELSATENAIDYDPIGAKTDFRAIIAGVPVGVSVARAIKYPFGSPLPSGDAEALVERKLADILESSENVVPEQAWRKQILAVLAYDEQHANAVESALAAVSAETAADTIVWIVVTDGSDDFIYCDGPCD